MIARQESDLLGEHATITPFWHLLVFVVNFEDGEVLQTLIQIVQVPDSRVFITLRILNVIAGLCLTV